MWIMLLNHATYSLSVGLVASVTIGGSGKKHCIATLILFAAGLLLAPVLDITMLSYTLILTLLFAHGAKKIRQAFYESLTAVFLLWCVTAVVGSAVMVAAPGWHGGTGFNIFMGLALVAFSLAVRARPEVIAWCRELEHVGIAIFLELLVIFFFSFILTWYYSAVATEDKRQWGIFCLSFLLVLSVVGWCVGYIKDLERGRRELRQRIESQQEMAKQTESQYQTVITLKHYYFQLFQSLAPFIRAGNMEGLRRYFDDYITPIHSGQVMNGGQLDQIRSQVIRNLIEITSEQVTAQADILLDVTVDGVVHIPDALEMDVFEILSNLLDNALYALREQENGLLLVKLCGGDAPSLTVANTIQGHMQIADIYNGQSEERGDPHGHGLKRVREIVLRHPGMEHYTYKSGSYHGRRILYQHIKIQ